MTKTTCKKAGTPKSCPKKTIERLYPTNPKAPKAQVTTHLVVFTGELTLWHAVNKGRGMRTFTGVDRMAAI